MTNAWAANVAAVRSFDILKIKPNCELCDKNLPADSTAAMIYSYACTFCRDCESALENICPNCGGGFQQRPIRPAKSLRKGVGLNHHPASTERVFTNYSRQEIVNFVRQVRNLATDS